MGQELWASFLKRGDYIIKVSNNWWQLGKNKVLTGSSDQVMEEVPQKGKENIPAWASAGLTFGQKQGTGYLKGT